MAGGSTWGKPSSGGGANSAAALAALDSFIGTIWYSKYAPSAANMLSLGSVHDWADHPKLKAKHDNAPNPTIETNPDGVTFTVKFSNDFHRPSNSLSEIGIHHDDTTAVNGLTGTSVSMSQVNVATRQQGGNAGRNRGSTNRAITLNGDAETAPNWEGVYAGIYGDF